tara:strand:- start:235 stop:618 length:384 start_codon:yes stop_codon:yes gene_type:complete
MAQDKVKKENIEADKALDNMTVDPVTGQPGDLYGAPEKPSQMLLDDMKEKETGIPQDPALKGTGQPGELYGAPEEPYEPEVDPLTKAKRKAQADIASQFGDVFWMRSVSPNVDFKNLNKLTKKKENV